jgi:hypothetical protein
MDTDESTIGCVPDVEIPASYVFAGISPLLDGLGLKKADLQRLLA